MLANRGMESLMTSKKKEYNSPELVARGNIMNLTRGLGFEPGDGGVAALPSTSTS